MKKIILFLVISLLGINIAEAKIYEPSIYELNGVIITQEVYDAIKTDILKKIKNKTIKYNEVPLFINIANREINVCGIKIKDVYKDNFMEKFIKELEKCKL